MDLTGDDDDEEEDEDDFSIQLSESDKLGSFDDDWQLGNFDDITADKGLDVSWAGQKRALNEDTKEHGCDNRAAKCALAAEKRASEGGWKKRMTSRKFSSSGS